MRMAKGELDVPQYLDQPPRLFSKKEPAKAPVVEAQVDAPPPKIDVDTGPPPKRAVRGAARGHQEVLDSLANAGIPSGDSAAALRKLREAARESPQLDVTYRQVADAARKMEPAKADSFLRAIKDTADLRPDSVKRLTGAFRAAARADDPGAFLHRLQGIMVSGPPGQALPIDTLDSIVTQVERVSRTSSAAAREMLDTVDSMLGRFATRVPPGAPVELAPLLRAIERADDPAAYLHGMRGLVEGLSHPECKLSKAALSRIGERVNTMPRTRVQAFVDAAGALVQERPRQVAHLAALIETAAKVDAPGNFLAKVGRFADSVAHVEDLVAQVGRKTQRLSGERASAFLDKLVEFASQASRRADAVGGFDPIDVLIAASTRKADPVAFLDVAGELYRRRISMSALRVLARKAEAGKIDLIWLHSRKVDDWLLDFLGRNPRTSWRTFQAAGASGAKGPTIARAKSRLRGLAGEFAPELPLTTGQLAVNQRVIDLTSEVTVRGTILDYLALTDDGLLRGLEVKAWTAGYWQTIIYAIERRDDVLLKETKEVLEPLASLERLFKQLRAAREATGASPILALSDEFAKIQPPEMRKMLLDLITDNAPAGTRIAWLNDAEIRKVANELARQLGIP
jgi:hypothetical protein